jgi:hypothetical protein
MAELAVLLALAGCAVRPTPDPRNPGMVRNGPALFRVCIVEGEGTHLAVGDLVELATSRSGRLRVRHLPGDGNQMEPWNGGDSARVRSAVLVERIDSDRQTARRFVPVGRFDVAVHGQSGRFDFLASRVTEAMQNDRYPSCNVDVGDDELVIRGVEHEGRRHDGIAHLLLETSLSP